MQNKTTLKKFAGFLQKACLMVCIAVATVSVNAQTVTTAGGTNYAANYGINGATNPGTQGVSFVIQNTNATALVLTTVNSYMSSFFATPSQVVTTKLYVSTTSISGPYDISTAAWTLINTGSATLPASTAAAVLTTTNSGMSYIIPAGAQYRFVLDVTAGISFSYTPTPTPNVFTVGGVSLKLGDNQIAAANVGYISVAGNSGTANTPFFFTGSVVLSSAVPCAGTPTPGNTISSAGASVCAGTALTLSAQNATAGTGVTYAWEDSSSATSPAWVPAPTPNTGATLTTTQTIKTWYRVKVTCSGSTGISTPVAVDITPQSSCYCTAASTVTTDEKIANVTFGSLNTNNTNTAGYVSYLTEPAPNLIQGDHVPLSITGNAAIYDADVVTVWIDYNQNGNFNDPGEMIYTSGESAGPYLSSILIPTTATLGSTRMRIRLYDDFFGNGTTGPCGNNTYGQVLDFTVNIVPCVPVSFTTQPTNATTTCGGNASFTVGLAGSVNNVFWEYKPTPASPNWLNVTNGGIFSGANTTTLNLTNATDSYNGYQFRAVVTGVCTGTEFSSTATLTVTQLVPLITPTAATICAGSIQSLALNNVVGVPSVLLTEGFDAVLPTGWAQTNNSNPVGPTGWSQGSATVFSANSGAPTSFISANFNNTTGAGDISDWLFAPTGPIKNGDIISFYTRIPDGTEYPDRLEVRVSTNGASTNVGATSTSVGDFSNLLLSVNPTLTTGVYPKTWTKFTATVSGLSAPTTGRVAFRYFVTNAGPSGDNSDYIGIDDYSYTTIVGTPAQGVWTTQTTPATIFTDAAATVPYIAGALANQVWVKPTATTTYSVVFATPSPCTSKAGTVVVTVTNPITGTSTVADKSICAGGTVSFAASAPTGGSPILHQWKVSTNGGVTFTNITNAAPYSGATTGTLTITGATFAMNGYKYKDSLYVTTCASNIVTNVATLTVFATPVVVINVGPYTKLLPNTTTTLTAATSPNAGVTYSWFKVSQAYAGATVTTSQVAGVTGNTLVVGNDDLASSLIGTQYYATVVDVNGCTSVKSNTIAISDSTSSEVYIYPNPSRGTFQVRYHSVLSDRLGRGLNVYDDKGARVYSQAYPNTVSYTRMDVDLRAYGKGVYWVEIVDSNGNRLAVKKVVIL